MCLLYCPLRLPIYCNCDKKPYWPQLLNLRLFVDKSYLWESHKHELALQHIHIIFQKWEATALFTPDNTTVISPVEACLYFQPCCMWRMLRFEIFQVKIWLDTMNIYTPLSEASSGFPYPTELKQNEFESELNRNQTEKLSSDSCLIFAP